MPIECIQKESISVGNALRVGVFPNNLGSYFGKTPHSESISKHKAQEEKFLKNKKKKFLILHTQLGRVGIMGIFFFPCKMHCWALMS
jgi:hypothetical protein